MIFMPLSPFVAIWLISEVHYIVLGAVTVPSTLKAKVVTVTAEGVCLSKTSKMQGKIQEGSGLGGQIFH